MKKVITALVLCISVACGGSTEVTGPSNTTDTPVAEATPAPTTPVVVQPPASPTQGVEHNSYVTPSGYYYSKTLVGDGVQSKCAAAFGIFPNGNQGAHTNIYENQSNVRIGDYFDGTAPVKAECKYDRIQIDVVDGKDCRLFKWTNVLAARVVSNPNFPCPTPQPTPTPEPKCDGECDPTPQPTPTPTPSPSPTPTPSPSPTPTPQPTCTNTAAFFKGSANGGLFNLANSSDANELAWVNTNVGLGPWEKFGSEGSKNDNCTGADFDAKVVIVKAGSENSTAWEYRTYINVTAGQQICSYNPPEWWLHSKDISHVSYFRCD